MIRAGVVGVGSMGAHHARVYDELEGVSLAGVVDEDADRAASVAADTGTTVRGLDGLLAAVDVASVAVPTPNHHAVATECLKAGVHTLVEKPLVTDVERGEDLAALADERGLVLTAGHVERFNPAVETLGQLLPDLDVLAFEARRLGPPLPDDRGGGDVVLDLMIHDIDVIASLVDGPVETVGAAAIPDRSHVTATLRYDSGPVASLIASRATHRKVRCLNVVATDRLVTVDYLDQSVEIYRRSVPAFVTDSEGLRYRHEQVVERPIVGNREPLVGELTAFVEAVRGERPPAVTPAEALAAVATVAEVRDRAGLQEVAQ